MTSRDKLIGWSGDFRREDLAAAVVQLMCDEGALFALQMAHTHRVRDVIICGSFFNHPLTWKRLSASFLQDSLGLPDAVSLCNHLLTPISIRLEKSCSGIVRA